MVSSVQHKDRDVEVSTKSAEARILRLLPPGWRKGLQTKPFLLPPSRGPVNVNSPGLLKPHSKYGQLTNRWLCINFLTKSKMKSGGSPVILIFGKVGTIDLFGSPPHTTHQSYFSFAADQVLWNLAVGSALISFSFQSSPCLVAFLSQITSQGGIILPKATGVFSKHLEAWSVFSFCLKFH